MCGCVCVCARIKKKKIYSFFLFEKNEYQHHYNGGNISDNNSKAKKRIPI